MMISRRDLLKGTVAAGTVAMTLPFSRVLGANDDLRVGAIGLRSKGDHHVGMVKQILGRLFNRRSRAVVEATRNERHSGISAFAGSAVYRTNK